VTATPPAVGEPFPVEALEATGADLSGPVVVYFYPEDDLATEQPTTCSRQAMALNQRYGELLEAGVRLVGISTDDLDSHQRFAAQHGLRFPLASDPGGELLGRAGLLKDFGEFGVLADRVTYLIDGDGIVRNVWHVTDVEGHPDEVLAAARALGGRA